jgi:putative intracellular protease/amidase
MPFMNIRSFTAMSPVLRRFDPIMRFAQLVMSIVMVLLCVPHASLAQAGERALVIVPSRDFLSMKSKPTGYRLLEVAQAWDTFKKAGMSVDLACNGGGRPAVDTAGCALDSIALMLRSDTAFQHALSRMQSIALAKPERYTVAFFTGGLGALWDYIEIADFTRVASAVHARGGILATVGAGAAVLLTVKGAKDTTLAFGARLTCVSDEEVELDGFSNDVPYLLETALRRGGASYFRLPPHTENTIVEDRLITGQNAESARETARTVLEKLKLMRGNHKRK